MRADRLLSILLLLQAKGRLTGRELARRLEVSMRTLHRDMEALSAAGVPVFAERGSRGGWRLDEGWRTRVPGLDEAELRALLMAQPRVVGDARLARAAERALEKLMAALPASLRQQASSIQERLLVDTTGWSGTPEDLSMLEVVQDAVARDRRLAIRYRPRGREPGDRVVDPLGLVAKGGTWYLVARAAGGLRTYRVSRIESARALEEGFSRPAGFDLAAHWKASTEELRRGRERYEATLRLAPEVAASFQRWRRGPPAREPEGWITLTIPFEDEDQAAFVALGLGPRVDVVEPGSLRLRVASDHAAALSHRGRTSRTPAGRLGYPMHGASARRTAVEAGRTAAMARRCRMDLAECRALLGHTEWADSLVWQSVLSLPQGDAEVQGRLHHLHMVQWAYLHIWRGEGVKPRELGTFPTREALRDWAREYYGALPEYLARLTPADLPREVRFPWADRLVQRFGKARPATWAESVMQVAMHSCYHRGQVARRLRELGAEPPLTDYIAWIWTDRPAADWGDDDAA